jgi:hypothetical protein
MLDPKFKSLCIVCSFVEKEQGVVFVEKYDKTTWYLMLVKCHKHLHLTRPQLLEGFKEESQVEDNGKGEGVGARSLTHSTRR